jgi:hypothetical protein
MKDYIKNLLEAEAGNILGICIGKGTATVVCLGSPSSSEQRDSQVQDNKTIGCFSVSVQGKEGQNLQMLATLIAQGCAERRLEFSEAAVAINCAMFMQHNIHSSFTNPKQIASTVRFDTEEALAMDISDIALAFNVTSSDQAGSEITVFTAQRKLLTDVLLSLQSNNIDPVSIEPDVNCLSRFICRNVSLSEGLHPLFGMLSHRSGYLVIPPSFTGPGSQQTSVVRTFLVSPTQDRSELLAREILMTTALIKTHEPINCLKVLDSAGLVDYQRLSSKLGIEATGFDPAASAATNPQTIADCETSVDFAIAYGAALALLEKTQTINLRNDFMPYQGKKLRMQKALRFASYSFTFLMLAIGMYFQAQLFKLNSTRDRLRSELMKDYAAVMPGQPLPLQMSPLTKLGTELRRIKDAKSGMIGIKGEKSISSKLTLMLQAINSCAEKTNLSIDSISITEMNINAVGNTTSRTNTLNFFEAVKKSGMEILQQRLYTQDTRDHFSITVVPQSN